MTENMIKQAILADIRKTASVNYLYPEYEIQPQTQAPEGYEVFYFSHLGRHGSRHLIDNQDFKALLLTLERASKASALTETGVCLLEQLQKIWPVTAEREGDLTEKGVKQQQAIANRMFQQHNSLLTQPISICARSTIVPRCLLSMTAFCDQLKSLNPKLSIRYDAGEKFQAYLNYHTPEAIAFREDPSNKILLQNLESKVFNSFRLMRSLFLSDTFVLRHLIPIEFMKQLYNVASILQNLDIDAELYSFFTTEELFDIWVCKNHEQYLFNANAALNNRIMMNNAKPLLMNILTSAQGMIDAHQVGGHLRFAHDGNLIPLAMLMHLSGCYESEVDHEKYWQIWQDYRISPMGGNIQLIFYRNLSQSKQILVKCLLNENEIKIPLLEPHAVDEIYYPWAVMQSLYWSLIKDTRL